MRFNLRYILLFAALNTFCHTMPPIETDPADPPPPAPSYVQVSYTYQGDKITGSAAIGTTNYVPGEFLGNAIVGGACLDMNNQWQVTLSAGWNGWDGWYVNKPKYTAAPVSSFGTQKSFYWQISNADPSPKVPYFAFFTYSFGYNTDSTYTTFWSSLGWDNVYSQYVNLGGVANTWHKSGTNHDTYRVGPVLVWGFPTSPEMAGTITNYSKNSSWLGWNGDSCLWGVELYRAVPQNTSVVQVPFSIAATTLQFGSWVDIPLQIQGSIDYSSRITINSASIFPYSQSFVKNCAYYPSSNFDLNTFTQSQAAALSILDPEYHTRAALYAIGSYPSTGLTNCSIIYINNQPYLRAQVIK